MSRLRSTFDGRPTWINASMVFCGYMAFIRLRSSEPEFPREFGLTGGSRTSMAPLFDLAASGWMRMPDFSGLTHFWLDIAESVQVIYSGHHRSVIAGRRQEF